jgi:hypothetical protein
VNAFISWMATVGSWAEKRGGHGEPMKYQSIKAYVDYVGCMLRELHKTDHVVTDSLQTHWALLATKRLLGDTKQRARPITLPELKAACENISGPEGRVLAFRVIALTAWFAALRLGQLLPTSANKSVGTMSLSDLEISEDGQAVLISSSRSKTNVFRAKVRKVAISACASDPSLCLKKALTELLEFRRLRGLATDVPLSALHEDISTFDKFVGVLQQLIPRKAATAFEKGHVTGHSFRRGFTKAALLAGFSIEQIMLHGDWSHPDSVTNSYAAGAVLPSIPMARHVGPLLTGAAAFVAPPTFERASGKVVNTVRGARPRPTQEGPLPSSLTADNPFAPTGCSPDIDPIRLSRQARQWEFDNGYWLPQNPFRPTSAAPKDASEELQAWLQKRARQWELQNNSELVDKDSAMRNAKKGKS